MKLPKLDKQTQDFFIITSSGIIILGMFAFQDLFFSSPRSVQPQRELEVFQLEVFDDPVPQTFPIEETGVIAYNELQNIFVLQSPNGLEYVVESEFANFLELVGMEVSVSGEYSPETQTIKVTTIRVF